MSYSTRFEDTEDKDLWACEHDEDGWCLEYDVACSDVPRGDCKR